MKQVFASVFAAWTLLTGTAHAQETRVGEEGFESPLASIEDAEWLIGQWAGDGIGGAEAYESWLAPSGGTMVGTFVQENADGTIMFTDMFTEHMYLMEQDGSLVVKLKHFNSDLTGWEDKDGMLTFRLLAMDPCALYFNALTYRCVDPEEGPDSGIVVAVRMKSDKPEPQELFFTFKPVKDRSAAFKCDGNTIEINQCLAAIRDRAKLREDRYFEAAVGGKSGLPARMTERERLMRAAQDAAEESRKQECGAVYEQWKAGTIRNAMALRCEIRLIDQRTHDIWQNWLTYQDSSEPMLPEPGPSR